MRAISLSFSVILFSTVAFASTPAVLVIDEQIPSGTSGINCKYSRVLRSDIARESVDSSKKPLDCD